MSEKKFTDEKKSTTNFLAHWRVLNEKLVFPRGPIAFAQRAVRAVRCGGNVCVWEGGVFFIAFAPVINVDL